MGAMLSRSPVLLNQWRCRHRYKVMLKDVFASPAQE